MAVYDLRTNHPPGGFPFVTASMKASRLVTHGFDFPGEDLWREPELDSDMVVEVWSAEPRHAGTFLRADDAIQLYTPSFAKQFGIARAIKRGQATFIPLLEAARALRDMIDVTPTTVHFGPEAGRAPIYSVLYYQYEHLQVLIRALEGPPSSVPAQSATPSTVATTASGTAQQPLPYYGHTVEEPKSIDKIVLGQLLQLKREYHDYQRRNAGQYTFTIDKYIKFQAATSLDQMTPPGLSTMEKIDFVIKAIQQGTDGGTGAIQAAVNTVTDDPPG
jgi:hypothetical protein